MGRLTRESLLRFVEEFKSQLFVEGLIQGNVTETEALEIHHFLLDKLQCKPLPKSLHPNVSCSLHFFSFFKLCVMSKTFAESVKILYLTELLFVSKYYSLL